MNLPPVDRAQLVATRRDLHQHPELGFEERRTGTLVAERLTALGVDPWPGTAEELGLMLRQDTEPEKTPAGT